MRPNCLEEIAKELFVAPCAWSGRPWQTVVREIETDEQWLQVSNGVGAGVDERGERAQVPRSNCGNVDVESVPRKCMENAADPARGPVLPERAQRHVVLRVASDISTDMPKFGIADKLGKLPKGLWVDALGHRSQARSDSPVA